jgi:D-aspartate ligase
VPVLVLKLVPLPLHHGGVGIIRSLGRMGVPVYGVVEDRFTPATVSRYLNGFFIWNTSGLATKQLLEGMAMIGERLSRPTIVIPTDDAAAIFLAEQAATLQRWFLLPDQPASLPRTVADKKGLYQVCRRIGEPCPDMVFPTSIDDVHRFAERAAFPLVAKVAASWLLSKGGFTPSIAHTPEEACTFYRRAESQGVPNLILQEYIPPGHGEDWFYHGYRNLRSNCCLGFTGRKLRSYPPFAGPTTLGKAVLNQRLQQQVEALLQTLSYAGITDLDYRLDKRDGQYKLLDFNPRVGAQFRLFEDAAGVDVVRALYLDLTGRPVTKSRPLEGRTFIAEFHDPVASLSYFRHGRLTVRDWWLSFKGRREWAWFSRHDPLPFLVMGVRQLLRVAGRLLEVKPAPKTAHPMPYYGRGRRNWVMGWR